jgi:hypothetical protein
VFCMNCHDFENIVNDLAREQMMKASVRTESLLHRDECEACARRLDDESALSFKLRALAAEMRFTESPALDDKLRTAFRDHQFATSQPAMAHRWRYWAAAAAIVLAVIALAGMRFRPLRPSAQNASTPSSPSGPESTSPGGTAVTTTTANAPIILVDSRPHRNAPLAGRRTTRNTGRKTDSLDASPPSTPDPVAATGTATTLANNSSATEIATDFIPVGYQNAMNLQDGGQIVRVQLPRSALVAFGLPVNMDRYNEKVKADVFFGTDGMPRAIRFVQ